MQYYYKDIKKLKLKKEEKKELKKKVTALDRAILAKAKSRAFYGAGIYSLVKACRPFKNRFGGKEFASPELVRKAVSKLVSLGLLEVK